MKQKILSLLVLLLTAATGAWAEEATITLKCGTTEKTYENVTLPWSTTAEILNAVVTDIDFNININAISGGDGKVVKYGNENFTVTGTFSGEATVVVSYNTGSSATITVTAPRPLMTLSDDGKTATMESMPDYDATAEYELVRDLAQQTKVNLVIGSGTEATEVTANTRLRIAKSNNVYAPVSPLTCYFFDQIEQKVIMPTGFAEAKLTPQFYLQGANETWTLVTDINTTTKLPNNLQPGQVYCITLKAADGAYYDGETPQSFTVTLFEGYEVEIAANGFATYYKDEPLKVDESTPSGELYTISSVSASSAVLSEQIEASPSSTPLIVFNNSDETKVILLTPMAEEPNLALSVAPEFKGTNESKTFSADEMSAADHYVLRDTQFVWVKNAGTIGANKCWLEIASGSPEARSIVFGDATGISGAVCVSDDRWYDLNGRKISKPVRKGVYIINGRKVVVK